MNFLKVSPCLEYILYENLQQNQTSTKNSLWTGGTLYSIIFYLLILKANVYLQGAFHSSMEFEKNNNKILSHLFGSNDKLA